MTNEVQSFMAPTDATCDMSSYKLCVLAADYARLEQECKDAKCQAELMQRAAEVFREERDAALLRASNLEIVQAASLGVSGLIKSAASELGFDPAGEDSALDYVIMLARRSDAALKQVEGLRGLSERIAKVWIGHAHIDDLVEIQREIDAALSAKP